MDWLDKLNKAMDYIESNLACEISYDKAAQIACCSTYYFQRMFPYIMGVTLSEYIRRRRLTLASFDMQTGDDKVVDVALKYGYDSPEAFTRAFKKLHGVSPISVRDMGIALKAYPRITFQISLKGDIEMDYRIMEREAFEMFGVYGLVSGDMEQAFLEVPQFCRKCDEDGSVNRINALLGRFHDTALHSMLYDHDENGFKYMIGYYAPKGLEIPEEFTKLNVPARTWAVFSERDCTKFHDLWRRIYSEWFPTSGYEQEAGPQFEMYYGMAGNVIAEIWIPIKKK